MISLDSYRHLDEFQSERFRIEVDMEQLAAQIIGLNYGTHRLLSSIARQRLDRDPSDELAQGIKALLNSGLV